MIYATIIVLLLLPIAILAWRTKELSAAYDTAQFQLEQARQSAAHHKEMEEAEEARADELLQQRVKLQEEVAAMREQLRKSTLDNSCLGAEIAALKAPKPRGPARILLKDDIPPERIAEILAGTSGTGAIKAIVAHVGTKLVGLSDMSTEPPREQIVSPDRIVAGYTEQQRLHDAGGAYHLAELLRELQELTAAKDETKEAA